MEVTFLFVGVRNLPSVFAVRSSLVAIPSSLVAISAKGSVIPSAIPGGICAILGCNIRY